jgi:hypothetical protein
VFKPYRRKIQKFCQAERHGMLWRKVQVVEHVTRTQDCRLSTDDAARRSIGDRRNVGVAIVTRVVVGFGGAAGTLISWWGNGSQADHEGSDDNAWLPAPLQVPISVYIQ